MILIEDEYKKFLDDNNIPYATYETPAEVYLVSAFTGSIQNCVLYNGEDSRDENVMNKYVDYIKENINLTKFISKLGKLEVDILKEFSDLTEGKHDEIMKEKEENE